METIIVAHLGMDFSSFQMRLFVGLSYWSILNFLPDFRSDQQKPWKAVADRYEMFPFIIEFQNPASHLTD